MHAAVAQTGCINGASSTTPITTAAESADKPITATTTESVSIRHDARGYGQTPGPVRHPG